MNTVWNVLTTDLPPRIKNIENIDPAFLDASSLDFHLLDSSPCVTTGENLSNMGAYQVQGTYEKDEPAYQSPLSAQKVRSNFRVLDSFMRSGLGVFRGNSDATLVTFPRLATKVIDLDNPGYTIENGEYKKVVYDYNVFIQWLDDGSAPNPGTFWVEIVDCCSFKVGNEGLPGAQFVWTIGGIYE